MTEHRPLLDTLADMTAASVSRADLAAREVMLVRVAGLVAVDAPPASYLLNLGPAADSGLTLEDARSVLVTLAPSWAAPGSSTPPQTSPPPSDSPWPSRTRWTPKRPETARHSRRTQPTKEWSMQGLDTFAAFAATYDRWTPPRPTTTRSSRCTTTSTSSTPSMPRSSPRTTKARSRSSRSTSSRCARAPGSAAGSGWRPGCASPCSRPSRSGAGIMWGAGIGAGLGALAGHAAGGMSRSDLKDLGETLDTARARSSRSPRLPSPTESPRSLKGAEKVDRKELKADPKAVQADVAAAGTRADGSVPGRRTQFRAYRERAVPVAAGIRRRH